MIKLYTRNNPPCSYCEAAKTLLKVKGIEHEITVVGPDGDLTKEQLLEMFPNVRTFPVVLEDSDYIGGFKELKNWVYSRDMSGISL
jgi:glutaredoxin